MATDTTDTRPRRPRKRLDVIDVERVGVDREIDGLLADEADATLSLVQPCNKVGALVSVQPAEEERCHGRHHSSNHWYRAASSGSHRRLCGDGQSFGHSRVFGCPRTALPVGPSALMSCPKPPFARHGDAPHAGRISLREFCRGVEIST